MAHIRQQIRDAVVTAVTGLGTGATVYDSRVYDLPSTTTTAIMVDCGSEEFEYTTMTAPRTVSAVLDVMVTCVVVNATSPEDTRDTMLAEIQAALASSDLGGVLTGVGLMLDSIEVTHEDEAEIRVMSAEMVWQAPYVFAENDPETAI